MLEWGRNRPLEASATVDLLQGYCQFPLAKEACKVFIIVTPKGSFTPTRAPQGILNATTYYQVTLQRKLEELSYRAWVGEILMWSTDFDYLLQTLDAVLGWLERVSLYATVHNACCMIPASSGAGRCIQAP